VIEDPEEHIDDEDEDLDDEDLEEGEPAAAPARAGGGDDDEEVESSLEELLAKKEDRKPAEEEEEDDPGISLSREERLEPLAVKVVPPQTNEFVCKKCYLVKHRSQLKDKARMFCRDCA